MVRVQVRAKIGIARGEHRPNLSPETRESEARQSRPSQSTFHGDHITENAPRGEPPPSPTREHAPSHMKNHDNNQHKKKNVQLRRDAPGCWARQLGPGFLTSGAAVVRWCSSTSSSVLSSSSLE